MRVSYLGAAATAAAIPFATGPVLDLGFAGPSLPSGTSFARASAGSIFDASGTLQSVASGQPRFDYGAVATGTTPSLLVEPARTNSIRNPRGEGANGAAAPTNWSISMPGGLSASWSATTVDGIPAAVVTISGTASGSGNILILPETATAVAAANGQTWTFSGFTRLVSGSLPDHPVVFWFENTAAGAQVVQTEVAIPTFVGASAPFRTQRFGVRRTLSGGASVGAVQAGFRTFVGGGTTVSFTLMLCPQLEWGDCATSPILPPAGTPAATTRAADTLTVAAPALGASGLSLAYAGTVVGSSATMPTLLSVNDGTAANAIELVALSLSLVQARVVVGGTSLVTPPIAVAQGQPIRAAISLTAARLALSVNGAAPISVAASGLPTGLSAVRLGNGPAGTTPLVGRHTRCRVWASAISDAELVGATTAAALQPLSLSNPAAISSSEYGDALAHLVGRVPGSKLTLHDQTGQLQLSGEVVRRGVASLAVGALGFSVTEVSALGSLTTALTLTVSMPLGGTTFNKARIGALLFGDDFLSYPDLFHPTNNPTGKWKTFYPSANGYSDLNSRTLSYTNGSGNAEGEVYSEAGYNGVDPFSPVPGGGLLITAMPTDPAKLGSQSNLPVTSGMLRAESALFTSGHYAFRGRWDSKQGIWPAYWLYNHLVNDGPQEIDVLEAVSYKGDPCDNPQRGLDFANQTYHAYNGETSWGTQTTELHPNTSEAFHTYACFWDNSNIFFMIDGVITGTTTTQPHQIGHQMDVLINLASGWYDDSWPGHFVPAQLPYRMWTDYVRVKQALPAS